MIAKNPTPPPPHLFSLAQRRWKDSLVGLLHILPRLGKSGGHIPHSSPFSYSLRLSLFFFFFLFLHLRVEAAVFCWRWGTHGTLAGELFGEADWVGGRDAQTLLGAAAGVSGKACSLEYKTQRPAFTAKCALCPATWIWVIISRP